MARFCEETGYSPDFAQWLALQGIEPIERTPAPVRNRKLEARSLSEPDWQKLQDVVSESDRPEDVVILLMCTTGLRVGDALRIGRNEVLRGVDAESVLVERKGGVVHDVPLGVREPWERLAALFSETRAANVAGLLAANDSPLPGQAAYKRMDRRLKALARELSLSGRMHTHKLRRTVAVRAIRTTHGNVHMVQKLLGHRSPTTTQTYVDERREAEVADLQRQMWRSS